MSFLTSNKLASAMDNLVDRLIAEASSSHNQAMVDMMQQYRQLQFEYPQYKYLLDYAKKLRTDQPEIRKDTLLQHLTLAARPLQLSDDVFQQLLKESDSEI